MRNFTLLTGDTARTAEDVAREATSPEQFEALRSYGASPLFFERPGRPLPAVARLEAPCFFGHFVDEDEFYRSPPSDLIAVNLWGGVTVWSGGQAVEEPPEIAAIERAKVGAFSTGPVLLLRWIGPCPSSVEELLAVIEATDAAYGAWWQDWDARGRPI